MFSIYGKPSSFSIFITLITVIGLISKYKKEWIFKLLTIFQKRFKTKPQPKLTVYSYSYPYTPDENVKEEVMKLPIIKVLEEKVGSIRPFQNPKWLDFYQNHFIRGSLFNQDIISYAHSHYSVASKTLVSLLRLDKRVCGHDDIVHGGLCAALFDEIMGEVFYCDSEGKYMGFTASLTINYKSPMPSKNTFVWCVQITKREGRKVFLKGQVRDAVKIKDQSSGGKDTHGNLFSHLIDPKTILYAEAEALFIIPKTALPSEAIKK